MTDDEVDARFAEIVRGLDDRPSPMEAPPAPADRPPAPPSRDPLDPEPDVAYTPDPQPSPRLSRIAWVGTILVAFSLATLLGVVFGLRMPRVVGGVVVAAFVVGVALLFSRLPWRRDPLDGDGAQL